MNQTILNPLGEKIDYAFSPASTKNSTHRDWLVILAHGVTGNKDRPLLIGCADALNEAGFDTLRFSFAGNGNSEGDFRQATISKEMQDLRVVIDAVSKNYPRLCCLGHSMGGAVSTLVTAADPRVNALVSLAGMVNTKKFADDEFGEVTPDQGFMWDDEESPLSTEFMNDLRQNIGSVLPQAKKITVPWLLLHGSADDVVNPSDSTDVASLGLKNVSLQRIDGADHVFSEPSHLATVAKTVANWLSQQVTTRQKK